MKYALIEGQRICEFVATAAERFPVAIELQWVEVADATSTMDSFVDGAVAAYVPPPQPPQQILSQDLMAQFTTDDLTKIRTAVDGNIQFWGLWSAMQAQSEPMGVTNARFLTGWGALVQVLGTTRMAAIATALGVTI